MKEEKNHIDKLFQDTLGERTFDVPSAFLADLEAKLDNKKTHRGGWISFLTILFFTALIGSTYALLINPSIVNYLVDEPIPNQVADSKTEKQKREIHASDLSKRPEVQITEKKGKKKNNTLEVPKKSRDRIENSTTKEKSNSMGTQAKKVSKEEPSTGKFNELSNNSSSSVRKSKVKKVSTSHTNSAQSVKKTKESNRAQKSNIIELFPAKTDEESSNSSNKNKGQVEALFPSRDDGKSFHSSAKDETNPYAADLFEDTLKKPKRFLRDSIIYRDSVIYRDSLVIRDSVVLKYQKDPNRKLKFEAQVYAGFMRVQPKITSPFDEYKKTLKAGEKSILSPDFGFQLNAYYKKWTLGTGLKYYQFGEKTNYSTLKITSNIDTILVMNDTVFLDSNGQIWNPQSGLPIADTFFNTTIDTSYIFDSITNNRQWQNSYTRFVIPLNFGFRFDYRNWAFIPRVGLNFEFTTARQKGVYIDALKEEFIELQQRKFGLSYQLSVELRRSFGHWHAFINPYYRSNFGYVIDTPDLKRRYGGFGATFGVGMEF